jgi:hypothetical protein
MRHLQRELLRAKEEIRRIQSVPLVIGQFNEMIDANYGIVSSTAGSELLREDSISTLDRELLKPNTSRSPCIVIRIPSWTSSPPKVGFDRQIDERKSQKSPTRILVVWMCRNRKSGRRLNCH